MFMSCSQLRPNSVVLFHRQIKNYNENYNIMTIIFTTELGISQNTYMEKLQKTLL